MAEKKPVRKRATTKKKTATNKKVPNKGGTKKRKAVKKKEIDELATKLREKSEELGLNPKQKRFSEIYINPEESKNFGNLTLAYQEAYDIDKTKKGWYDVCSVNGSRLIRNAKIIAYTNFLLGLQGLNDAFVDNELLYVLKQREDLPSKMAAVREWNKVKGRITDRIEMEVTTVEELSDEEIAKRIANHKKRKG